MNQERRVEEIILYINNTEATYLMIMDILAELKAPQKISAKLNLVSFIIGQAVEMYRREIDSNFVLTSEDVEIASLELLKEYEIEIKLGNY